VLQCPAPRKKSLVWKGAAARLPLGGARVRIGAQSDRDVVLLCHMLANCTPSILRAARMMRADWNCRGRLPHPWISDVCRSKGGGGI